MNTSKVLSVAFDDNGELIFYVMQVGNNLIKYFEGDAEIKEIPMVDGVPTIGAAV